MSGDNHFVLFVGSNVLKFLTHEGHQFKLHYVGDLLIQWTAEAPASRVRMAKAWRQDEFGAKMPPLATWLQWRRLKGHTSPLTLYLVDTGRYSIWQW